MLTKRMCDFFLGHMKNICIRFKNKCVKISVCQFIAYFLWILLRLHPDMPNRRILIFRIENHLYWNTCAIILLLNCFTITPVKNIVIQYQFNTCSCQKFLSPTFFYEEISQNHHYLKNIEILCIMIYHNECFCYF